MELPLIVKQRLQDFSSTEKAAYYEELNRRKKSIAVGYLCLIILGWHYAYVKKWGTQIVCLLTFWGLLIWWVVDWFRIPSIINEYNKNLSVELLDSFSWVTKKEKINKGKNLDKTNIKKNMTINDSL